MRRRPRDNARSRLYTAERAVFSWTDDRLVKHAEDQVPEGGYLLECEGQTLDGSDEAAQDFLNEVSASTTFVDLGFQRSLNEDRTACDPVARLLLDPDYRGTKRSHAGNTYETYRGRAYPTVYIARPYRGLRWLLLHEAAHWCVLYNEAWHGHTFAHAYLALVGEFLGLHAHERLREEFFANQVDHHQRPVVHRPDSAVRARSLGRDAAGG